MNKTTIRIVCIIALISAMMVMPAAADEILWEYSTGLNCPDEADRLTNGNTLITDDGNSRVIEVTPAGIIDWEYNTGLNWPFRSDRLPDGNTLIGDCNNQRVIEVTPSGTIDWQYSTAPDYWPFDVHRLSNGNTLIGYDNGVIEVTTDGTIFWEYSTGAWNWVTSVDRLSNGNTLITDEANNRIIEVTTGGTIFWEYSTGLSGPYDADRLSNGNTLITDSGNNRIIEVTTDGTILWEYSTGLSGPQDADRLPNGNTLIADCGNNRVIEVGTPTSPTVPVKTATGSGTATFESNAGTIEDLTAIAESAMPGGGPDLMYPHGFFSFNITDLTPGQTVDVTVTLPDNVPVGSQYWKYHGGWVQIPIGDDDGDNVITIQLTDGGLGDSDSTPDGTIVDPGTLGVENLIYLDPDNSVSTGSPVQVDVYTYINATDKAMAASFDIVYDTNCIQDFPSFDTTGSGWVAAGSGAAATCSTPSPGVLRFSSSVGMNPAISGHVLFGTLTITCNTTCCGSALTFTNNPKYTDGSMGTVYPALDHGTFLCDNPSDPIMTVTKEVWDESTSSWADTIGPLGSEWMDKDARFKITATAGCLDLSGVAVDDAMDVGLEYNNSATLAEDSSTTHTANWTIGALAAGTSQSIEFNATIAGYGTNCNTATVTGTVTSLGAAAPTVSDDACVTTLPPAGINVTKTVWDESTSSWVDMVTDATIGDTYRFRCEVENIGSPGMDVCDITVIDVLPAGLSYADNAKLQSHHGTWWDIEPPDINDPANNMYGWVVNNWVPGECLQVGQKIVIEYDVTVDNYGLSCNNITAEAYCSAATSWVQDNDSACIDVPKPDLNVTAGNSIKVNPEIPYLADFAFGPVDHPGKRTQPNSISAEVQECNGVDVIPPFDVTIVVTNSTTSAVVATCTTTLPGLTGGTEVTVWCNDSWYPTAGWDYTIDVTVDPADVIPETDETNNTLLRDITAHNHGLKGGSWQSADSNITTLQYHNGTVNLLYSTGDSVSTGSTALQTAQGIYLTNWTAGDFSIPVAGSTIKKARLYVYYNWEKTADRNVTDYFTLDFNGYVLPQDAVYSDVKAPDLPTCGYGCADPIRKYAYPYGMVAYDVTHKFLVNNDNTATLTTDSDIWSNKKVSMTGMLLVVVYENSAERERIIWINEGFDMLKAGEYYYDHKYVGVNTEEATTHAPFTGCPSIDIGGKADLVTVVNHPTRSGNLDQEQALYFNGMLLDQGYDVWTRLDPALEIGINTADVTALLQTTDNIASIQSVDDAAPAGDPSALGGDWFEASNAFLIVDKAITTMTVEPEDPASGECYEVGERFDVLINIDPIGNAIRGAQFDLHYNGSVIMVDNFELGGFLIPPVSIDQQSIDNSEDGVASFAASTTGGTGGATTPGTFVIVHCMAMGQGATSELDLTGVVVYNDNLPIPEEVPADVYNSSVEVCDNAPPVAVPSSVFTYNNMADKVLSKAYFDGTASHDDDGAITVYGWWFGDGATGVGPTTEHAFNVRQYWEGGTPVQGGHYIDANVTLIVTDDGMPLMDNMTHIDVIVWIGGDANGDGVVNIGDSVMVGYYWGGNSHANEYADRADLNNDGIVNIGDSIPVGFCWGHTAW